MFRLVENNGVPYYIAEELERTGLCAHGFTTRAGGVSGGDFESLNLRLSCGDSRENIIKNYELIAGALGIPVQKLILSKQVHRTDVREVGTADCGNGLFRENRFDSADALMTNESGAALVVFSADCVPVLFLDKKRRVIAAAHSGWRGTCGNIAAKTVVAMGERYGSAPEDIICAIGASIRQCCFEVGEEVAAEFDEKFIDRSGEKPHIDLQGNIAESLCGVGVKRENIVDSGICTCCRPDEFYSHRRVGDRRGAMAAILMLK